VSCGIAGVTFLELGQGLIGIYTMRNGRNLSQVNSSASLGRQKVLGFSGEVIQSFFMSGSEA
jgi:hypothetical protein